MLKKHIFRGLKQTVGVVWDKHDALRNWNIIQWLTRFSGRGVYWRRYILKNCNKQKTSRSIYKTVKDKVAKNLEV